MRLCFTINVCFAVLNRLVIRWIATASPIPVYSSGQTPVGLVQGPTSGLLSTRMVATSESRNRFHKAETGAAALGARRSVAAADVRSRRRRSWSAATSSATQAKAVAASMNQAVLNTDGRLRTGVSTTGVKTGT